MLPHTRIQREYFKQQEAAGKLSLAPPSPKKMAKSLVDTVGIPPHVTQIMSDAESALCNTISKSIYQTSNPGYIVRDGSKMAGTTHKDYVYDEEEVAWMKEQGFFDKTHNRRRDEFVMYVEASVKSRNLAGSAAPH
jgi:hypothetical protein